MVLSVSLKGTRGRDKYGDGYGGADVKAPRSDFPCSVILRGLPLLFKGGLYTIPYRKLLQWIANVLFRSDSARGDTSPGELFCQ